MREQRLTQPEHLIPPRTAGTGPVLLVTAEASVSEAVAKAAAAAGLELITVVSLDAAGPHWESAGAILAGPDVLTGQVRLGISMVVGMADAAVSPWRAAAEWGIDRVVVLPEGIAWLAEYLGSLSGRRGRAMVLGVCGSAGGVGVSTLSAWLALRAAGQGLRTVLVSLDAQGPPPQLSLSAEEVTGIGWEELNASSHSLAADRIDEALPHFGDFAFLGWPGGPASSARHDFRVLEALRGSFELVVLDLPRGLLAEFAWACDQLCLLSGLALAEAVSTSALVRAGGSARIQLISRARRREVADAMDLADHLGVGFAGVLPTIRGVRTAAAEGRLVATGMPRAARKVVDPLVRTILETVRA